MILKFIYTILFLLVFNNTFSLDTVMSNVTYDNLGTRYTLVKERPGKYNWLLFPGGAGADSSYFLPLVHNIELPGKIWLIDLKGNGSNTTNGVPEQYNFDQWLDNFVPVINKFDNPVYVGHSFGGLLPLLFPELENILKGLIVIGSSPCIDPHAGKQAMKKKGIVISSKAASEFKRNPTEATFKNALIAQAPCHFASNKVSEGKELFKQLPFNFYAVMWLMNKVNYFNHNVLWIPQNIPVLIMGGSEDCINPISLFLEKASFQRKNIHMHVIKDAGHFPWVEKMEEVVFHIKSYAENSLI